MNNLTLALAGIGGYVIYQMTSEDEIALPPGQQTTTRKDGFSTTVGVTVTPIGAKVKLANKAAASASYAGLPRNPFLMGTPLKNGSAQNGNKLTNSASKQVLDKATAKLKEQYKKLSGDAKKEAAKKLNTLIKPSPNLTGKETFEEASKKIGGALGATLGGTLGASLGPIGATLGAMAGAYLGERLGPEIAKQWNDLEKTFKNAYGKVGDAVDDAGDAVKDFIGW